MTGVDTLRAIIKNQRALADPLTPIDLGRFEWHFSPSEDLPQVSPTDVLALSFEERAGLIDSIVRIYKARFSTRARCWCAPCATVTVPGAVLISLIIEEPLLPLPYPSVSEYACDFQRVICMLKLSELNWWCFDGFGFKELQPEESMQTWPLGSAAPRDYMTWLGTLNYPSLMTEDTGNEFSRLLALRKTELGAAKQLLRRLKIREVETFMAKQNDAYESLIKSAVQGDVPANGTIAYGLRRSKFLFGDSVTKLRREVDGLVHLRGFSEIKFSERLGPFISKPNLGLTGLGACLRSPEIPAGNNPPLIEWMDSEHWHRGLGVLGGFMSKCESEAHRLLIREIEASLLGLPEPDKRSDAYIFIKGLLELYQVESAPAGTLHTLRDIAKRLNGPFAASLAKVYMFGFKVKRDVRESHRWLARSGVSRRLLEHYASPFKLPAFSLRLLDEISLYFAQKSEPIEAWAWQHLFAECPTRSLLNKSCCYWSAEDNRPYIEYDWSALESITLRAYEILSMFAEFEPEFLAQKMTNELRARLLGLRPHSTPSSVPDDYYLSATQFILGAEDQLKHYLGGDHGGLAVAPFDHAEALTYFALMLNAEKVILDAKNTEEAAAIFVEACEASKGSFVVEALFYPGEHMSLLEELLPSLSQPHVVERMISRLRLSQTLD